jgi:drug/metabolite transporter (DMT)-like permease
MYASVIRSFFFFYLLFIYPIYTYIFLSAILSFFIFDEKITWHQIVGLPLCIIGLIFMVIARELESRAEKNKRGIIE